MKIIDSHHHLWAPETDPANISYIWLKNIGAMKPFGDPTSIQRDYIVDEFRNESTKHELTGSVHVQCDGAIPDPVRESEWLETLQAESGLPSAHVGFLDLTASDAQTTLERYMKLPNFRGVRQILSRIDDRPDISFAPEHFHLNAVWREQFALLSEYGLSFDLQLYPQQMAGAAEFLAQQPDIPVVIDHAGSPYDQSEIGRKRWRQGLALLAELPHCQVKLSGFGMFDTEWNVDSTLPLFTDILELLGAKRMMWGSNFPVDKLMRSYDFGVQVALDCAEKTGLSETDIKRIFYQNAHDFYQLA